MENKVNVSETLLKQLYDKRGKKDKETFLRDYLREDEVRESYTVYLVQAGEYERLLGRELYEFNEREVKGMFANNFTSSPTTLRILFSVCKQYVTWATDRHLNPSNLNVFNTISFKKDILPMINSKALVKEIITEEQLWMIIDNLRKEKNAQDLVCLMAPFYGIKGDKNLELRFLKKQDIDEENNVVTVRKLTEDVEIDKETGKKIFVYTETEEVDRKLELPERAIKLLIEAENEKDYNKLGNNSNIAYPLMDSQYIVRPLANKNSKGEGSVMAQTVASRCKKVIASFNDKINKKEDKDKNTFFREKFKSVNLGNLSVANIWNSGKIHVLKQIEAENGKVENDDLKKVNFMFTGSEFNYENTKTLYQVYTKAE